MKVVASVVRYTLVLLALALAACGGEPDADVFARELYGSWVTDSPDYSDRGFDITADSVTLHQGDGIRVTYAIEKISRRERDSYVDYVITYRGVVSSLEFPLQYRDGENGPDLRFPNRQRVIWTRAAAAGD